MKTPIVSVLAAAITLATVGCSASLTQPGSVTVADSPAAAFVSSPPAESLTWREPLSATEDRANGYLTSNLLVTRHVRMALPEGWRFQRRSEDDPKDVALWIHDTGGNAVSGAYLHTHFDFAISPARATGVYADKVLSRYKNKEARRTEIDGSEAHVLQAMSGETGKKRVSTLIYEGSRSIRNIDDITLLFDPAYLAQNPGVPTAIASSFKIMPGKMAERRIKGSFSFRCQDGTLEWLDDSSKKWQAAGFSIIGKAGDNGVIVGVSRVSTTRFQDFFKTEMFQPGEIQTELHFAGKVFPARALVGAWKEDRATKVAYMFQHEGKDYLVEVFLKLHGDGELEGKNLLNDKDVRRILDTSFYFDG